MKQAFKITMLVCAVGALTAASVALSQNRVPETVNAAELSDSGGVLAQSELFLTLPEKEESMENSSDKATETLTSPSEDWRLLLVNSTHPVPEGYQVELEYVQSDYRMDARVNEDMKAMIDAAKEDGINLWVLSAYRTQEYQQSLFEQNVRQLQAQGMTQEEATAETAANVAVPGTSEHQTGLAADIMCAEWTGGITEDFAETEAYAWLHAHCAEYGFIERYPKDKTEITKIVYEPWHYRYVGKEHAETIMEQGITLEEYLGMM